MNYFNNRKNAAEYILMSEGYDGREVVAVLKEYLKAGSRVLEIGMGPGRDIPILAEHFQVTGSDVSKVFLDMYRKQDPEASLLHMDAVSMETTERFDCIYSNKVLHHLSREDMALSFKRQAEVLNPGGIVCFTLWYGDKEIEVKTMKFVYYNEVTILKYLGSAFEILLTRTYREMDIDDSMLLIARKV